SEQIAARGIKNPEVLDAMRRVPRHRFVPAQEQPHAYRDTPLPIGRGQTISQPYIVALMTELVEPKADSRVPGVGMRSSYHASVHAKFFKHLYTIEMKEELARSAAAVLDAQGYDNVTARAGDGYGGWPEHAPFDIIVDPAAPNRDFHTIIDKL